MAKGTKPEKSNSSGSSESPDPTFVDFNEGGDVTSIERAGRWLVFVIAVVVAAWLAYLLAASFVPRWWAQRVGSQVDGNFTSGVAWGFGYGFAATVLSLMIVLQVRRHFLNWWGRIALIVVALLVSAPNFMTLAVTIGGRSSAHAGRRIFDVNAPGFQWASLIGVIVGAFVVLIFTVILWRGRRARTELKELKAQPKPKPASSATKPPEPTE